MGPLTQYKASGTASANLKDQASYHELHTLEKLNSASYWESLGEDPAENPAQTSNLQSRGTEDALLSPGINGSLPQ